MISPCRRFPTTPLEDHPCPAPTGSMRLSSRVLTPGAFFSSLTVRADGAHPCVPTFGYSEPSSSRRT